MSILPHCCCRDDKGTYRVEADSCERQPCPDLVLLGSATRRGTLHLVLILTREVVQTDIAHGLLGRLISFRVAERADQDAKDFVAWTRCHERVESALTQTLGEDDCDAFFHCAH